MSTKEPKAVQQAVQRARKAAMSLEPPNQNFVLTVTKTYRFKADTMVKAVIEVEDKQFTIEDYIPPVIERSLVCEDTGDEIPL